jgi:transcriptional regulator with XRE-family HTH domain
VHKIPASRTALWKVRRARTLTQADMARLLAIDQGTYSRYESGRLVPDVGIQARIAAILGTSTEALWPAAQEATTR